MAVRFAVVTLLVYIACHVASQETYCGWPGKPLNGKVRRLLLDNKMAAADLTPNDKFGVGSVVGYKCQSERMDVLRGEPTRLCQPDGRWSGERPWCDINVAFGKPVQYSGFTETTTEALTDGLSDSNDPVKTAECPVLAKINPYFEIDLLESYPIHFVAIYGKDGTIGNMMSKTLRMDNINCVERNVNKTSLLYECSRENDRIDPQANVGRRVRFEHVDAFSVAICEVVVYVNPSLSDCGEPEIPADGQVTITNSTRYQEARYECSPGYELSGMSIRRCSGRKWNGFQPLCIKNYVSTTPQTNSTTVPSDDDGGSKSMSTLELVLVIVCLSLVTALIIGFACWLCNKYNCCLKLRCKKQRPAAGKVPKPGKERKKLSLKFSPDYQKVNPPTEPPVGIPVNPTVEHHIETETAEPDNTIYANVIRNDQPLQSPPGMETSSRHSSINYSPVYSKMIEVREKKALSVPVSPVPSVDEEVGEVEEHPSKLRGAERAERSIEGSGSSTRKSFIPYQYQKTSPEQQRQQQLLNDHLKDFLKQKDSTASTFETDF